MLIIGGATATGKSHAAIMLAKLSGGEIVSADSMQIYKHMNIGTAKITVAETQGVPHHMIDIVEPTQEYSVAEYQKAALEIIKDIESRGKIPIVVGGTGLYINALIYPLRFGGVKKDEGLRNELKEQGERFGYDFLYDKLCSIDAESAKKIHKNNVKRVIRALEIKLQSGESLAENADKDKKSYYKMYAFDFGRADLYEKINKRVDIMMKQGLVEEVQNLILDYGLTFEHQSMQAIGYKEFKDYFDGNITHAVLEEIIKRNTRKYAKRQFTWFRAYSDCVWMKEPLNEQTARQILDDYYKYKPKLEQLEQQINAQH